MRVRKIDPDWNPSENPSLQVGEVIDISDPKVLILNEQVEALGDADEVITAYELYGILTPKEEREFRDYLRLKRAKEANQNLMKKNEELNKMKDVVKSKQEDTKSTEETPKVETKPVSKKKKSKKK